MTPLLTHGMQAHSRAVETSRSISNTTMNFFDTLDMHATKLTNIVEEGQTVNNEKLCELERKFEVIRFVFLSCLLLLVRTLLGFLILYILQECAANEEKQLLEKVAELLAVSNARKKELVNATSNHKN